MSEPIKIVPPQQPVANVQYRKRLREWAVQSSANREWIMKECKHSFYFWLESFAWLYEPRPEPGRSPLLPFIPWPHQRPVIDAILNNMGYRDIGIEKARGEGATWMCLMILLWRWIFHPMQAIGIVSRNEMTADNPDDPDSLGAKLDWSLAKMPEWMVGVKGVDYRRNISKHTWINLQNDSTMTAYPSTGDLASGGRKANRLDTKILTPTGWTTMGELQVGSIITGANGKPTEVLGVYPLGERQVYRVTFSDGSSTECCDEHLWTVTNTTREHKRGKYYQPPKWTVLPLKSIIQHYDAQSGRSKFTKYKIPLVEPVEYTAVSLPLEPYLLGILLGDGHFGNTNIRLTSADLEIVESVSERLPATDELVFSARYDYRIRKKPNTGQQSTTTMQVIRGLGLAGTRSHTKFIPEVYKRGTPAERRELLRGLMDSDGWCASRGDKKCKTAFCSTSKQLAKDVQGIVWSLGGVARISSRVPKCNCKPGKRAYELTINLPEGQCPFRLSRKADNWSPNRKYIPTRFIETIEPTEITEVQCIRVAAEDALYVCEDYIVTHNTVFFMDELSKFPRGDDEDALAATEPVTNCRLLVSTYNGADGAYYRAMTEESTTKLGILKCHLKWTDNPYRSVHSFVIDGKNRALLDPTTHEPVDYLLATGYTEEFFTETYPVLLKRGFCIADSAKLIKKIWSPWYVERCMRPRMTPQKVAQEYDMDPIGSGNRFFPAELLDTCLEHTQKPTFCGDIEYDMETLKITRIFRSATGLFRTWLKVDQGGWRPPPAHYIVGCDVAQGLGTNHSSNSAICIINRDTGIKVAEFASPMVMPEKLAEIAIALCRFFSCHGSPAYLIWEANGPGGAFRERVIASTFRNIYYRNAYKIKGSKPSKEPGWWSSVHAKQDLMAKYRWALQEGFFSNPSSLAIREAGQYVTVGGGRLEYVSSSADKDDPSDAGDNHGDRVIADAVANMAMEYLGGGASQAEKHAHEQKHPKPMKGSFAERQAEFRKRIPRPEDEW